MSLKGRQTPKLKLCSACVTEAFRVPNSIIIMKINAPIVVCFCALMSCLTAIRDDGYISPPDSRTKITDFRIFRTPYASVVVVTCTGVCSWSCSGMLIGTRHVLTTAHCIKRYIDSPDKLTVGVSINTTSRTSYSVDKVFVSVEKLRKDEFYYDYGVLRLTKAPGPSFRFMDVTSWDKPTLKVPVYFAGFPTDAINVKTENLWVSRCKLGAHYSNRDDYYHSGPHPRKHEIPFFQDCDVDTGTAGTGILISPQSRGAPKSIIGLVAGVRKVAHLSKKIKFNMALLFTHNDVLQIHKWISK